MEAAKGRIPLQKGYGSAESMKDEIPVGSPGKGVPRPDIPLWLLRTLSCFPLTGLLGVDHFYARSPFTGVLKFLLACCIIPCVILIVYPTPGESFIKAMGSFIIAITGCIFFSLWYIWDAVQVTAEGDRVVHYGMSLPFDLLHGIAQGMVIDKKTHYEASSSILDIMSRYFGWLFPAFSQYASGNSNGGHRLAFISLIGGLCAVFTVFKWRAWETAVTFGVFHWVLMIVASAHWFMMRVGYPEKSFEGLQKMLNYFNLLKQYKNDEMDKAIAITKVDFTGGRLYQPVRRVDYDKEDPEKDNPDPSQLPPIIGLPVFLYRLILTAITGISMLIANSSPLGVGVMAAQGAVAAATAQAQAAQAAQAQAQAAQAQVTAQAQAAQAKVATQAQAAQAKVAAQAQATQAKVATHVQKGGSRDDLSLSTESQILGATVFAIIGGGIIKSVVDSLV